MKFPSVRKGVTRFCQNKCVTAIQVFFIFLRKSEAESKLMAMLKMNLSFFFLLNKDKKKKNKQTSCWEILQCHLVDIFGHVNSLNKQLQRQLESNG